MIHKFRFWFKWPLLLFSKEKRFSYVIANITGFWPGKISLYHQAFRHHSVSSTVKDSGFKNSNERLEFLGDSILSAVVAEYLFLKFPFKNEGFLTEMRSKVVSRESLNDLAMKMGVDKLVKYDVRQFDNPLNKRALYGNAFEALVGAIYLDLGYAASKKFVYSKILQYHIDVEKLEYTERNFKGKLLEWAQKNNKTLEFELIEEVRSGKMKLYKIKVQVDGEECGIGEDYSKKKAEQIAAEKACEKLSIFDGGKTV
ncbi:MAG TPA: ribonuclease III [Bacteroidia bacterium]|nr:ribonuclease III [Bacteroidia bacterium]